jgi:hypothetical protein
MSKNNLVDTIKVDGFLYTADSIRKLKEDYEYNRETLLRIKKVFKKEQYLEPTFKENKITVQQV